MLTAFLAGVLTASLWRCFILYCQREKLARENSDKDLGIEILRTELKNTLALLARFRSGPSGPGDHMAVSSSDCSHVPVKSMEK
jgi:hypothetical protein